MGLFGGSAQATNSNQANIFFNPHVNVGDGSTASTSDFKPTSTTTPKLDESTTASVGVGVAGGSGSGGAVRRSEDPYTQATPQSGPLQAQGQISQIDKYLPYIMLGGGALILVKTLKDKKAK